MPTVPSTDELARDLQRVIQERSHQFIFVDDGGAGHHDMGEDVLVQDHVTYTAIILKSQDVPLLNSAHEQWIELAKTDAPMVRELHGTEIINPKKDTPWFRVDMSRRAKMLVIAAKSMLSCISRVLHGHIGKAQYDFLVSPNNPAICKLPAHVQKSLQTHKGGLEHVFHVALGRQVKATGVPTVIVQDEDQYRECLKHQYAADIPIWQGGIVYQPSYAWPGIQAADLFSMALCRLFRIKFKNRTLQPLSPLDLACEEICHLLEGKLFDVLSDP
jgi:hypothetical protein